MKRFPVKTAIPVISALAVLTLTSCVKARSPEQERPAASLGVVPLPLHAEPGKGEFVFTPSTKVFMIPGEFDAAPVMDALKALLRDQAGLDLHVETAIAPAGDVPGPSGTVVLEISAAESGLGPEGYRLDVAPEGIRIRASAPAGLFYGVQTIRQLIPADRAAVPSISIEDRPRFSWRGGLLDTSRHFFPKEFVKRWIDILAMHKMNMFHWHLTDDQGWRVEVGKYPKLTEVGAWRVDREDSPWNVREPLKPGEKASYGGFYTREDIREIVAYARSRFVTIVPEIEMPGHAVGALAAYPRYSCSGGPFTVLPGGYWPNADVFCPGNDGTFAFLDGVLAEIVDLFPGTYVHIGGDEVDKSAWKACPKCQARIRAEGLKDENELQSYFIRRIEALLNARGRSLIGWDEILEGGLAPRATVMSWRGTEGGIAAARAGHDVIMTPTSHCYFDYYQGNPAHEPRGIGGFVPLEKVYAFEPVPDVLTAEEAGHVLGGQANLWTEYIPDGNHAEYMMLPRLAALAEAVWSPKEKRAWPDFAARLPGLFEIYTRAGWNFSRSAYEVAIATRPEPKNRRFSSLLRTELPGLDIRFTTDGTDPGPASKRYVKPLVLRNAELRAAAYLGSRRMSPVVSAEKALAHAALGRTPAIASPTSPQYPGSGPSGLVDGLFGSRNREDGRWLGFDGVDFEAVVDLGAERSLKRASVRFLQDIDASIYPASSVEFAASGDGKIFEPAVAASGDAPSRLDDVAVREFSARLNGRKTRFVRVRAANFGRLNSGAAARLLVDEVVIE